MRKLRSAWYIILYHEISWEENCYLRSIGGTCPPDLFRRHVKTVASHGELVSIEEGEKRLREGTIDGPIFSFWFDDGLIGVAKYAAPILTEAGVTGAISICSRFVDRQEFFWRFKLSYINSNDSLRFLRSRMRKDGFKYKTHSVRDYTLDHFTLKIRDDIHELFERHTHSLQREDAYRMFMDRNTIRTLANQGWTITNHSAAHYPIGQDHSRAILGEQFQECETVIEDMFQKPSRFWVMPFDHNSSPTVVDIADEHREDRYLVFVGNRKNTPAVCNDRKILYRVGAPIASPSKVMSALRKAP